MGLFEPYFGFSQADCRERLAGKPFCTIGTKEIVPAELTNRKCVFRVCILLKNVLRRSEGFLHDRYGKSLCY